jgi:Concanavalin A-like lectin/glucanases superfamily
MTQLAQRLTNGGNLLIPGEFYESLIPAGTGSAMFDGSGSTLEVTSDLNSLAFGSGSFTIEWYMYVTSVTSHPRVFSIGSYPSATIAASIEGDYLIVWLAGTGDTSAYLGSYTDTWVHVAICREYGGLRVFLNGEQQGFLITSAGPGSNSDPLYIGDEPVGGSSFVGLITNFQWVVGNALYNAPFVPPTIPISPASGCQLLLLCASQSTLTVDSSGTDKTVINNNGVAYTSSSPAPQLNPGVSMAYTTASTFDEVTLSQGIIKDGLYAWFDAGNPASYPGSGYTWYDISGSGFTGSLNDIAVSGQGGGTMVLNGSTSYIQTNVTDPGSLPISLCFWAQSLSVNRWGLFDTAVAQPNVLRQTNQYTPSNTVEWWNGDPLADLGMAPAQWQYFTINYYFDTNRHVEVIINGVSHTNAVGDNNPTYAWLNLIMGCINLSSNFFNGYISQAQIYKRRLSTDEALYNYTVDAGRYGLGGTPDGVRKDFPDGTLQIKGEFDEVTLHTVPTDGLLLWLDAANPASYPGSGTTWYDISGNGHDVTLYNGASFDTNSINFAYASSQYGAFAPTNMFTGDLTVAGWVYVRTFQSWSRLFDFGNGVGADQLLLAVTDGTSGLPVYSINNNLDSPTPIPLDQWVQLAATQSGTTATLYIDGLAVATNTQGPVSVATRNNNYIGRSNYPGDGYLDGKIASLIMWNRAFTAGEIDYLYWATRPT